MALIRISMLRGKSPTYIVAMANGIQRGVCEGYGAPEHNRLQIVSQHEPGNAMYGAG